jgi:hypothetical protein
MYGFGEVTLLDPRCACALAFGLSTDTPIREAVGPNEKRHNHQFPTGQGFNPIHIAGFGEPEVRAGERCLHQEANCRSSQITETRKPYPISTEQVKYAVLIVTTGCFRPLDAEYLAAIKIAIRMQLLHQG